jgi:FMN phosphatase YigB (HAD superfamily)
MLTGRNRVVLFDLDHTLYEAFKSRKRQIKHIFRKHFGLVQFPWSIYFAIRKKYRVFDLVYDRSFHHSWLSPELVALLVGIINRELNPKKILCLLNRLENEIDLIGYRYIRPGGFISKANETLRGNQEFRYLINYINKLSKNRFVKSISWDYENSLKLEPYKGVKEGIEQLKEMGISIYITTEGDYFMQRLKLKKLSLLGYFTNKILASEILEQNRFYRDSMITIRNAIATGKYWRMYFSRKILEADENIRNFWMLKKKDKCFYYIAVLNAIFEDQENPERILKTWNSTELLEPSNHVWDKLIMFGDRADKDVTPLWRLFKEKVHIIRIKKGQYMSTKIEMSIPATNYVEFSEPGNAIKYLISIFKEK